MAKEPRTPANAAGGATRPPAPDGEFTTARLSSRAGEELSDYARLCGKTAADVYDEHLAPVIRRLLRAEMEARLRRLGE